MKKRFLLIGAIFVISTTVLPTFAINDHSRIFNPRQATNGSVLNMEDCVGLAIKNSPKIRHKKYALDMAKSRVGVAQSSYFPVIGAGIGFYNENNSDNVYYNSHYRDFPNVGVSVNQMVWDFGRTTSYIKMEKFYEVGAEYELLDSICATLFDVKHKYYEYLKAKDMLAIAERNLKINKIFVEISKTEAALATAKLYLNEAEIMCMKAKTDLLNAKVNLSNAMYVDNTPNYTIQNTPTYNFINALLLPETAKLKTYSYHPLPFNRQNATNIAYANNPELKVLNATKGAMEQSLKFIQKTYFPTLSANAGYGFQDTTMTDSNNSLRLGLNLSSSVNLMNLKHSLKGADAQLAMADNTIDLFKRDLDYSLKKAFNELEDLQEQIPVVERNVNEAYDNYKIVVGKYKAGITDYTALQDGRKDYYAAMENYINKIFGYNMALIRIEMITHSHIVDIHHKAEHAITNHEESLIEHFAEALNCDEHCTTQKQTKWKFNKNKKIEKKENL